MNTTFTIRKAVVLAGAVLLVSAFVAYSAGAFTFMSGSKSGQVFQTIQPTTPPTDPGPTPPVEPTPVSKTTNPTVFSGSKSIAPLLPPPKAESKEVVVPKPAE